MTEPALPLIQIWRLVSSGCCKYLATSVANEPPIETVTLNAQQFSAICRPHALPLTAFRTFASHLAGLTETNFATLESSSMNDVTARMFEIGESGHKLDFAFKLRRQSMAGATQLMEATTMGQTDEQKKRKNERRKQQRLGITTRGSLSVMFQ